MNRLRRQSYRILVVDDESIVCEVIQNAISHPRRSIVCVYDGEEAITLLLKEPFDMVIADKNLPGITGLDVIRRAKAIDSKLSTLMITAYASRESAEEAMALGVDDYIIKPFDISELIEKVEESLAARNQRLTNTNLKKLKHKTERVVICDPVDQNLRLLEMALQELGRKPILVKNVKEALAELGRNPVDVLVCDLDSLKREEASACFLRSTLMVSPQIRLVVVARIKGLEHAVAAIHHGARKILYHPLRDKTSIAIQLESFLNQALT